MTSDRHLALMTLMREITAPAKAYDNCVRRAAAALTDSPEYNAAVERGNAALDDIEEAVRRWVAAHPEPKPAIDADAVRTKTLATEADRIVAHCPDHGSKDGMWMDCHCAVASDLRRRAAAQP